jgi:hypothetical protein
MAAQNQAPAAGSANIFGGAAGGAQSRKPEKRNMIKNVDHAANQCLEPFGVSVIDDVDLGDLWKVVSKGSKWAHYHSNLGATDTNCPPSGGAYRVGIGISQYCECMVNVVTELKGRPEFAKLLKEKAYNAAVAEGDEMMPHFQRVNAGKSPWKGSQEPTFGNLKKRKASEVASGSAPAGAVTPEELLESCGKVWTFLSKESPLRQVCVFLGAGGLFYGAQVADKVTRAWQMHADPKPTLETFAAAVTARHDANTAAGQAEPNKRQRETAPAGLF